jgi:hypothetical protein
LTTQKRAGLVVTNIPFMLKTEMFQHLKNIEQPFIILAPTTCLHTKYFNEIFKNDKIQLIIPSTKRQFDRYVDGVKIELKDNCSFYTLYICFKANLAHDVNFIRINLFHFFT